jgi:hypothetical protein
MASVPSLPYNELAHIVMIVMSTFYEVSQTMMDWRVFLTAVLKGKMTMMTSFDGPDGATFQRRTRHFYIDSFERMILAMMISQICTEWQYFKMFHES